ncbi:MAG: GGDEF domain-containing protein [Bacteriovoracaceae bacterium]
MKEKDAKTKLLEYTYDSEIIKDVKSIFNDLNIFCTKSLSFEGLSLLEIPGEGQKSFHLRVHVNRKMWEAFSKPDQELFLNLAKNDTDYVLEKDVFIRKFVVEKTCYIVVINTKAQVKEVEFFELLNRYINFTVRNTLEWHKINKYEDLIFKDDVTSLFNQRKLLVDLDHCIKNYHLYEEPFYIYFIDIDHFKKVNDRHGHLIGTELLLQVGQILKNLLRETDYVYRYGGDEFVAIIRDVDDEMAIKIGQRILRTIKENDYICFDDASQSRKNFSISVSIGVASFPRDAKEKKQILAIADKVMYEAKNTGRGKVCFAADVMDLDKSKIEQTKKSAP